VSLRRINGWEPTERHEHFDSDGTLTGYTVVTREPEWNDTARAFALALAEHDRGVCPGCGIHKSILDDPAYQFEVKDEVCRVCRQRDVHDRISHERNAAVVARFKDGPPPSVVLPADGRHAYIQSKTEPTEEG
jgi:hypothetical protein